MFYTIYKITNQIDGKFYIGSHKTKDLDDNYMGSGRYLKFAQKKYGIENFKKEILFVFETADEMYAKEAEIVNEDFLATENTYNLKIGGFGGWDFINDNGLNNSNKTEEQLKRGGLIHKERCSTDEEYRNKTVGKANEALKAGYASGSMISVFSDPEWRKKYTQAPWSESAREKRKKTRIERQIQQGRNNSQFGTTWVWHELFGNRKIKKELLVEYLYQGWYKKYRPGYKPVF